MKSHLIGARAAKFSVIYAIIVLILNTAAGHCVVAIAKSIKMGKREEERESKNLQKSPKSSRDAAHSRRRVRPIAFVDK